MMQSENIAELCEALAIAQSEIKNPVKNKTAKITSTKGSYTYKYADIADVLESARPVLSKHGLSITQPTVIADGMLILRTRIAHKSGQFFESEYPVCTLGQGDHKAMGAAMTMARRYALTSLIGVASDEDTDAEGAAGVNSRKSSAQAKRDGDWDKLQADLADCGSAVAVDKLQKDYQAHEYARWKYDWQQQADELFEKRREDFGQAPGEALSLREQLVGSIAAMIDANEPQDDDSTLREAQKRSPSTVQTRADYIREAHYAISVLSIEGLRKWWKDAAPDRKRFRLTPAEESDLQTRCAARVKELSGAQETAIVPNARERAEAE